MFIVPVKNPQTKKEILRQLINFFVYETKGQITKTQLVKFIYLADLYAVKWTNQQLTDLDWRYYYYGPWEGKIDKMLDEMMNGGEICLKWVEGAILIKRGPTLSYPSELPLSLRLILENIRRDWAGAERFQPMLDYVYQTAPMVEASQNHCPEERARLNLVREREKLLAELY